MALRSSEMRGKEEAWQTFMAVYWGVGYNAGRLK